MSLLTLGEEKTCLLLYLSLSIIPMRNLSELVQIHFSLWPTRIDVLKLKGSFTNCQHIFFLSFSLSLTPYLQIHSIGTCILLMRASRLRHIHTPHTYLPIYLPKHLLSMQVGTPMHSFFWSPRLFPNQHFPHLSSLPTTFSLETFPKVTQGHQICRNFAHFWKT